MTATDVRPATKEQVESLGGEFLVLDFEEEGDGSGGYGKVMSDAFIEAEMALFAQQAIEVDLIITTAMIPGRDAPKLITGGMIETMRQGSVIVDLAAESGGNCVLTQPGRLVEHHGVSIVGYTDLPSRMATQSSALYANNIAKYLLSMGPKGESLSVDDLHPVDARFCVLGRCRLTHCLRLSACAAEASCIILCAV